MSDRKTLLSKVRKIEIKTRGLSNALFSGEYHSAFKGRGMSFSEVREYQYGDDVRAIDWNVTARFNHPYVKIFEEERELTVLLLVDMSGSAHFGTQGQFRQEMITEICAVLSFSAIQNNDKVGVIFFTDDVELFIPPKKGKKHILRIIRELIEFKSKGQATNIRKSLEFLSSVQKKRSIAFLISDFLDENYEDALRIAANKHDLVGIRIKDRAEESLPKIGLVKLTHPETGQEAWVDTSLRANQKAYQAMNEAHNQTYKQAFIQSRADELTIMTTDSYVNQLLKFFKRR